MNRYFKYPDITGEDYDYCYVELNEEYYCLRAIYITKNGLINTSLTPENLNFGLPEGSFIDGLDFMTEIGEVEFFELWEKSKLPYLESWRQLKSQTGAGMKMTVTIVCFYPEGVILNIDQKFYGLADHSDCENLLGKKLMYPKQKFDATISSFDDLNLWVRLRV